MSRVFRFEWHDDGSQHDDLKIGLGDFEHVADSYYFAIDGDSRARSPRDNTRRVMGIMLDAWMAAVRALHDGATTYLPFDFSDQCTGWLRVERRGDRVTLCAGWSLIEGWSFNPSDFSRVQPRDFEDMGAKPVEMSIDELIADVEHARATLAIANAGRARKR